MIPFAIPGPLFLSVSLNTMSLPAAPETGSDAIVMAMSAINTALGTPVPSIGTVWGEPTALETIVSCETRGPIMAGAKVTSIEQAAPGATLTHPCVAEKSASALPADETERGAL